MTNPPKENSMREVKFRAWDKKIKRMYEPDWIVFDHKGYGEPVVDNCEDSDLVKYFAKETDEVALMQYTGLKDKNGVEIYEGDIVKLPGLSNDSKKVWQDKGRIVWSEAFCGWAIADDNFEHRTSQFSVVGVIEVIGNIHENGDLLK